MGYHSGLNGEYNIPVEVNSKHIAHFRRCCKEEVPEKAIKVETYLKDDTIYFVLPNNYKPVKICFAEEQDFQSDIYGGKGNQKLNVDFRSTGYHQDDNYVNISDSTNYNSYTHLFDSLLDLNNQINAMGYSAEEAGDALSKLFDKLYNK